MSSGEQFRSLILEGEFHALGCLVVQDKEGRDQAVLEELEPFIGRRVRFVMHYQPSNYNPTAWGLGCCLWQRDGHKECPAGHHKTPNKMLVFQATGVLTKDPWAVDGVAVPLEQMPGHEGRLVVASDFKPPEMTGSPQDLDGLLQEMSSMREFIAGLGRKDG